jgi:hypothetical protein
MSIGTGNSKSVHVTAVNTVSAPVNMQPDPHAPIPSGTVGHTAVNYSRSASAAMVKETYVVANKK